MQRAQFWKQTPTFSIVLFCAAVFLIFASIGSLNDVMMQGRGSAASLWMAMFCCGSFAVIYAMIGSGFYSSNKRWFFMPVVGFVQFLIMNWIYRAHPGIPSWTKATPE